MAKNFQVPKFKICLGCKKLGRESLHPIENFYNYKRNKDKHRTNCKECDKARSRDYHARKKKEANN